MNGEKKQQKKPKPKYQNQKLQKPNPKAPETNPKLIFWPIISIST